MNLLHALKDSRYGWFHWLAELFGWTIQFHCKPMECSWYGCDFPYCAVWKFTPEKTA